MELKFLGRGAAFNPKEGNTSAWFIENNELFLIDCGESVYRKLIETDLLEQVETINLMITHTHSDHTGSLGSLVMYSYYNLHKPLNIILPEHAKHISNIKNLLTGFGCGEDMYNFIDEKSFDFKYENFQNIRYIETSHCKELNSYGLIFNTLNGVVYYSGDTNELNVVKALIEKGGVIDKLYLDTTSTNYPGNVHLYIGFIDEFIPDELKEKVYCMHINSDECIELARTYGFNVVNNYEVSKKK